MPRRTKKFRSRGSKSTSLSKAPAGVLKSKRRGYKTIYLETNYYSKSEQKMVYGEMKNVPGSLPSTQRYKVRSDKIAKVYLKDHVGYVKIRDKRGRKRSAKVIIWKRAPKKIDVLGAPTYLHEKTRRKELKDYMNRRIPVSQTKVTTFEFECYPFDFSDENLPRYNHEFIAYLVEIMHKTMRIKPKAALFRIEGTYGAFDNEGNDLGDRTCGGYINSDHRKCIMDFLLTLGDTVSKEGAPSGSVGVMQSLRISLWEEISNTANKSYEDTMTLLR